MCRTWQGNLNRLNVADLSFGVDGVHYSILYRYKVRILNSHKYQDHNMQHIYKKILIEMERLRLQGIQKLGRPYKDPEVRKFEYELMLFMKALDAMPTSDRRHWKQHIAESHADLIISGHKLSAPQRIANRKNNKIKWVLPKELQARNQAQTEAMQNRILNVLDAMKQMKLTGQKITSKTVLRRIQSTSSDYESIQSETIRKDIAVLKKRHAFN